MDSVLDVLKERGFVQDISDEKGLREALAKPLTFYSGFDPTGISLQAGHLVPIMAMRHLQQHGHRPIALIGGGTARIGDPSGKTSARPMLSEADIDSNAAGFRSLLGRYLSFEDGLLLDNKEWLCDLRVIPFLREIGRHFSVNQMLAADVYKSRLETGLSFLEFNYMLLQAYDFLHLFRTYDCQLYVGGSDQWSNSLAGVDLIRRAESARAFTLVNPLLTTASGQKMGKTEHGAVFLDANLTSPYEFYQFWINTEDGNVPRFLALFTELPMPEVRELSSREGAALREAKERLAFEATALTHGEPAAIAARDASAALFGGQADAAAAPVVTLSPADFQGGAMGQLFVAAGLCESRNAARRLIEQGGATVDGKKVESIDDPVDPAALREGLLLRAGKKRFVRVVLG